MKSMPRKSDKHRMPRSAFTLVEMLVSVTLVLLMMTMFTSIFQMATNSVSKQRIIAESDQRSRSLTTILRADFAKRSLRNCFPFLPEELPATSVLPFSDRTGYVYISCNNTASGQDDLIQFTVDARQVQTNPDRSLYYGASKLLWDRIAENAGANTNTALQFSPNQPEADDGDMFPNGTAGSEVAEISLFMRGGHLIRRVMLLRKPLPVAAEDLEIQPRSGLGNPYFFTNGAGTGEFHLAAAPAVAQDDFWRFFDYSAVPANKSNLPNGPEFIGVDALANDGPATAASLGKPFFRFGFNPVTGISREHDVASASARFLGRYLHAETSFEYFNWPNAPSIDGGGNLIGNGNPMDVANTPVSLDPVSGLATAFQGTIGRGGARRVEDVLLSNVREFRIELWDSRLERWVVPGHQMIRNAGTPQAIAGDYHIARNSQFDSASGEFTFGPLQVPGVFTTVPHVFDTWHAKVLPSAVPSPLISRLQAPFYPLRYYPPRQTDNPPGPTPRPIPLWENLVNPATEYDPIAGRNNANKGYWTSGTTYNQGDIVFADGDLTAGWDANSDGVFHWTDDLPAIPRQSVHIAYRCLGNVDGSGSGTSSNTAVPAWQSPGLRFVDNDLVWEGFRNYQPLKSIRLTIQFIEPNSEQPKQLTLVMPMTDQER